MTNEYRKGRTYSRGVRWKSEEWQQVFELAYIANLKPATLIRKIVLWALTTHPYDYIIKQISKKDAGNE